ncbi:MAG: hypothetical protein EOP89_06200 [Lysobacteraceae bacterium]|nr:MAG: hypothetical protein EOP89_06200 [Xanthomonadaceae bacterium]
MTVRHFVTGASVFAIAVSGQMASAQSTTVPAATPAQQTTAPTATDAASPQAPAPDAEGIGDIVVTAQRRDESLQSVPLAITAISGETLQSRGVVDISRLNEFVPGFSFGQTGSPVTPLFARARYTDATRSAGTSS